MATSFNINVDDLMHILRQIKIAEAHSGGLSLVEAIQQEYGVSAADTNLVPFGLRTVDGTLNNLAPGNENFGAADQSFPRMLTPQYVNDTDGDAIDFGGGPVTQSDYSAAGDVIDADPRTISNLIVNQTIDNPAAVAAWFANPLSLAAFHERYGPDAVPVMPGGLAGQVVAIANANFDLQALPDGTINSNAPLGWTISGITGGTVDPLDTEINPVGHGGENAAWLQTGAVLSRVIGETVSEGTRYELSLNIGDRGDVPWAGGTARILATNGVDTIELSTLVLPDPGNGEWTNVLLDSGAIPAAAAGYSLMIEVQSNMTPFGHLLIDDVQVVRFNANEIVIDNIDIANIPNQSPDIGLSPGFNAWMTFFGQFFDHGLDLVTKANNGTVYIPLQPDDPLITHGPDGIPNSGDEVPPHLAFMAVTRAQIDGTGNAENTTTPFVDQNQTYTSHPSHQVFLREFALVDLGDGLGPVPRATGKLLDGTTASGSLNGAVANWGEVKAQALMLGIQLTDFDVHSAPLLATDAYGEFIPGANGYPQLVMMADAMHPTDWLLEADPLAPVTTAGAYQTNHAFLIDIAHHAAPGQWDSNGNHMIDAGDQFQTADTDPGVGDDGDPSTYDDEMLDAHFVTGDGRGNENIALTTVHSVFHSEHNRLVEAYKTTILETAAGGDLSFLNEWLLVDVAAVPADLSTLVWDGERLFQAGRFVTEMQYQHLVFEEFARRIQPAVDPFVFTHSPDVDAAIVAEFAHTVYRFGHSMLNDTVDRFDNNLQLLPGETDQATLVEAFLNPQMFVASGGTLDDVIANIVRGAALDVGNEMDEFVVPALQNNLLGLPLDLAAINIARGRETGIPSLNEARKQFYADYGLADLKPYTSWIDFAQHIKNPSSIINFIAAYGTHATITGDPTLAGKRAAAAKLLADYGTGDADARDFLNATGAYATPELGGMNNIDFWIGGLAEELNEFGGMLGSTFNLVFEFQMERLQTGDRFYYLSRTQGTNMLNQLEPNSFTDLVMRNSALGGDYATHLNAALFVTPDHIFELDRGIAQADYNPADPLSLDPVHDDPFLQLIDPRVVRDYTNSVIVDGTHDFGGYIKYSGGEHVVLGGTEGNDTLIGDKGIDAIWGDGGDDYINAGMESDNVFGGDGDDIIEDPFGDDVLRGEGGNDVISAGSGLDLIFGGEGNDYIIVGQDDKDAAGDEGDDFILGGTGNDFLLGGEGNDWIEGGAGFDVIAGENSQLFFNSTIIGHDVAWGQGNDQDYDLESGDDIALSGPGIQRFEGMFGFDWASGKYDVAGVDFDFQIPIFTTITADILRDRFDQIEAASGWIYDDVLDGDDRGHVNGGSSAPDSVPVQLFADHVLDSAGIDRIEGLRGLLGGTVLAGPNTGGLVAMNSIFGVNSQTFQNGNILIGGAGNDQLRGRGGYDILDGDAWLNVRIKIMHNGTEYSAESLNTDQSVAGEFSGLVFNVDANGDPIFYQLDTNGAPVLDGNGNPILAPAFGGRTLNEMMLDRTLNPGDLSIVREIKYDETPGDNIDTAVFQGALAEYEIEGAVDLNGDGDTGDAGETANVRDVDGDGFIRIRDKDTGAVGAVVDGVQLNSRGALTDDIDLLRNIEQLQFADQTIVVGGNNSLATGIVTIDDPTPIVGQVLTATLSNFADADGIPLDANGLPVGLTYEWQTTEVGSNAGWTTIQTSLSYTVRPVDPGHILRAVAVFKDNNGTTERITSAPTEDPTRPFTVAENSVSGTIVGLQIPFSVDYDPQPIGGNPPADVDLTTLHHEIDPANSAGGRFTVIPNGVDINGFPRYSVIVDQGGPVLLNYEAPVHTPANQSYQNPDNQYQIVINTYDAPGGTLVAVRQFTVLLSDVTGEPVNLVPSLDLSGDGIVINSELFSENFSSTSYTQDDGAWTQNWVEAGDDGSSTSDNGQIRINGGALEFDNGNNAGNSNGASITRAVDLSGATSATLSFTYAEAGFDTFDNETVQVQFAADGVNFTTVQTIDGTSGSGATNDLALTGPFSANSAIRFVVSAVNGNNDLVRIDNIAISKNTSTPIIGAPGNDFATSFDENGPAVGIALFPVVADADGTTIMGATVRLTNAQAEDALSIAGSLPAGITASFGPAVAGEITMYLAGPASFADLQTAIGQVRFANTGSNPNPGGAGTPRLIEVTVSDGESESMIATATVDVNATNNPVNAVNDSILTNIAQGNTIVIPEWVLLANDIDPDSVLDVTSVGGANGVGSLDNTVDGTVSLIDTGGLGGSFSYTASDGPTNDNANVNVTTVVPTPTTYADDFNGQGLTRSPADNSTGNAAWTSSWTETGDDNNIRTGQIQIDGGNFFSTNQLRLFDNGDGASIARVVDLTGATEATLSFSYSENSFDGGTERVEASFSFDGGATWHLLPLTLNSGTNGGGTYSVDLSTVIGGGESFGANNMIRFEAITANGGNGYIAIDNFSISVPASGGSADIIGSNNSEVLIGDDTGTTFDSGQGDDIVLAGGGNDTVVWKIGNGNSDGHDFVDGGDGTDTFVINANDEDETFRVYTLAAAVAAGLTGLRANAEIVITRDVVGDATNADIIAELAFVEEIIINTGAGNDTVIAIGDFSPTTLAYNTIRVNGGTGDDTVDISSLLSDHRVVLTTDGGNDKIVGGDRPQDMIVNPDGSMADEASDEEDKGETEETTEPADESTDDDLPVIDPIDIDLPEQPDEPEGETADEDSEAESDESAEEDDEEGDFVLTGTAASETLRTEAGNDMVFAGEGDDNALGGSGNDMMFGDGGNDRIFGEDGDDFINAGQGNDSAFGGRGNDRFVAEADDGNDTYYGDGVDGGAGIDTLDMSAITANVSADLGNGHMGRGSVYSSESGHDTIWNVENIITGSGDDMITASNAVNVIDGGEGNDVFRFNSATAADGDTISTFQPGDKIDLSGMDANNSTSGHQSFTLVAGEFSDKGQLIVTQETRDDDVYTVVSGNVSGGDEADFSISIKGAHDLTASDFHF